jgi:hypothetical protein
MLSFEEFLSESMKDGVVTCDNCGWHWDIVTGGDDPYDCHKCGHSNRPVVENQNFPNQIKSETYWRQILKNVNNVSKREYATRILDSIMKKQNGFASDRQMEILRRVEKGDNSPYHTKN